MIQIKNVSKKFGSKHTLRNLSVAIEPGERVCIIGPSGCGKSTLIKLLIGLIPIDSGTIWINGDPVSQMSERELYKIRRHIGFVFQSSALFDSLTVAENVAFTLSERRNPPSAREISKIVDEKLELVGMREHKHKMPSQLSGGQQRRIGLARAIAHDPSIILYDEPTAGLDPQLSLSIEDLIVDISKQLKVTSIVITHQISTMLRTPEKIYFMHEGSFLEPETPQSIKNTKQQPIHEFFKGIL